MPNRRAASSQRSLSAEDYWSKQRVLVTGAAGFLGQHVIGALQSHACREVVAVRQRDCDLTSEAEVSRLFSRVKPTLLIHLAGMVGGISANRARPADFFYRNLLIGALTLHGAYLGGVEKVVAIGAGCGYPEDAPLPLKESSLWNGFPQVDSAPYSLAKRMLHVQSLAYWQQHRFPIAVVVPGNVYGPHDNFDLNAAHVVPALVRKFADAADFGSPQVEIWGTGLATRDFVYAGDVARAILTIAESFQEPTLLNVSRGEEISIREVAEILRELTAFKGEVTWNTDLPAGQARRLFDVSAVRERFGVEAGTAIREGLALTVQWYRANRNAVRATDPLFSPPEFADANLS